MCGPTTNNLQYIFYKILYSDSFEGALSTEIEYKKTNKQTTRAFLIGQIPRVNVQFRNSIKPYQTQTTGQFRLVCDLS